MLGALEDTIVAIASAEGGAARGIVRISGPAALSLVSDYFQLNSGPWQPGTYAACYPGQWRLEPDSLTVPCQLYLWPTSRSYTQQPTAELHTLGSPPLLRGIVTQLCQSGARLAQPGEFTFRAFLAGRLDLAQAEAVLGVIDAVDQRQLSVALSQLAGGLSRPLQQLREAVLNLCADIEAGLDFVDEDIEFIRQDQVIAQLDQTAAELAALSLQLHDRSRADDQPPLVLYGMPNVGKSTLWNALVQRSGAIVSDVPGTTRDYLEATWDLAGRRVTLVDTAGIDASLATTIDHAAQDLSRRVRQQAQLRILCLDASRAIDEWEWQQVVAASETDLILVNKSELAATSGFAASLRQRGAQQMDSAPSSAVQVWQGPADQVNATTQARKRSLLPISAVTGAGLAALKCELAARLEQSSLAADLPSVAATATRCRQSLDRAIASIAHASELARHGLGHELIVAELRVALDDLGEMVGAVYTDDLLDRVFSRFCLGK